MKLRFLEKGRLKKRIYTIFKIKLNVYYKEGSKERQHLLEHLFCHNSMALAYDATSPLPKYSCLKKLSVVPLVLMINDKSVTACYVFKHYYKTNINLK